MPGIDDLVDGLAGGSDIDALVDGLAGDSAPEAQMTVGEPEVIKTPKAPPQGAATAEAAGQGLDAPLKDQRPWWQKLTDQATNFSALPDGTYQDPQNPTLEETARATDAKGLTGPAALRHLAEAAVLANAPTPFKGANLAARAGNAAVSGGYQGGLTSLDQGNSLPQVAEDTAVGAGLGLGLQGLGEVGVAGGKALMDSANKLRTHIFMTPAQRAAYKAAKGGDEALAKLGADARKAGLFKGGIGPATAKRVEANADRVMAESGGNIGSFEDDLVSGGVNPDVDVRPIGENLRTGAEFLDQRGTAATPAQAEAFRREASAVQPTETRKMFRPEGLEGEQMSLPGVPEAPTPAPAPPPMPTEQVPLDFESNQMSLPLDAPRPAPPAPPAPAPAPPPAPRTPAQAELPGVPVAETPEPFTTYEHERTYRPFSEAVADKRALQDQIKWNKSAMQDSMGGEAARKTSWQGHADQIDKALDAAAARGEIAPEALAGYRDNMKNFSTAATVYDPAMRMAERQGQIGLGAADLLAGAAAGDMGVSVASRAGRGRGAAMGAAITETASEAMTKGGKAAQAAARAVPAIGQALQNNPPGTPKSDIEREANSGTKAQLKGWWQHLTGK
jgi:hypothetical protein